MTQTGILLNESRSDYSNALNVLALVSMEMIPVSIEDVMYAYFCAKEWVMWCNNPHAEGSPILERSADFSPMSGMFEHYAENLSKQLLRNAPEVKTVFDHFNPSLKALPDDSPSAYEARLYLKSLQATAELFAQAGYDGFCKKLCEA
ncbi:MAG: hypothetical protein IJ689_05220 [Alphaproteobacteria bacterium]|nr:hypothetical protein [Alphaproteobacteria bacterium]